MGSENVDVGVSLPTAPIVVTGVAGFIGHHTAALLLDWGCTVVGIDGFTSYYDRARKEANLDTLRGRDGFTFVEGMLSPELCNRVFPGAGAVIHLAAQPGVRDSWAQFDFYVECNVTATKTVLDAAHRHGIDRVVYASSSSVYGDATAYPTAETAPTEPRSPYGITKLCGERLAVAYSHGLGLSTVSMRYFTVYGPGQRPDMAIQRLIEAALNGTPFRVFGDGSQIRDFTFVGDVARANALAALRPGLEPGAVFNICGGWPVSLRDVFDTVEAATGNRLDLVMEPVALGDVPRTGGTARKVQDALAWSATVPVAEGIERQVEFTRRVLGRSESLAPSLGS